MKSLSAALKDIAGTYLPTTETPIRFPRCRPGPNRWNEITADDYGLKFDYRIIRRGGNTVIDPCSRAAREWLYCKLPEDCPRWGSLGFVVENEYLNDVLEGMARDKLLSEDDYTYSMNAEDRDKHQGETGL